MSKKYMDNKLELEFKIKEFMDHFTGLDTPLKEYVCDEDGKLSEEQVDELIYQIISHMYNNDWYYEYYGMSGAKKVCLEQFLYLAITSYSYVDRVVTFRDILNLLDPKNMGYSSLFELYKHEVDEYRSRPNGFFGRLHDNYIELSGRTILEDVGQQENAIIDKELDDKNGSEQHKAQMEAIYDEYKDRGWDPIYELGEDGMPPDEVVFDYPDEVLNAPGKLYENNESDELLYGNPQDVIEEPSTPRVSILRGAEEYKKRQEKMQEEKAALLAAWKESIKNTDRFLESCRDFRKLYFVVGINKNELEETFIHFLHANGKCKLGDDNKVNELYVALARAKRVSDRS